MATTDPRISVLHSRLKAASDLRAASLLVKMADVDQTERQELKPENSSERRAHPSESNQSDLPAREELSAFCKEITPLYSSKPLLGLSGSDLAPRVSQRDLERSVQGRQIASNRQSRYVRTMKTFINPITRVEISQHELSEKIEISEILVGRILCFSVPLTCTKLVFRLL
jgi:hypothetical protein